MKKQTIINNINILASGRIEIFFSRQILDDDGSILATMPHAEFLEPGDDIDEKMSRINQHMETLKSASILPDDIIQIQSLADIVQTEEKIDIYREKIAASVASSIVQND